MLRAIINKPKIILADEPTSNLDYVNLQKICDFIVSIRKKYSSSFIIASDIAFPNNITVVDPNQYIMSLTNKESLEMELLIAKGQSYLISEKLKCTIPRNFLAIDAVFMPVSKVNFFVQPSSNNSLPDFESLILEI